MDDIKIRLALDGAEQVQAGANKAADAMGKLGASTAKTGQQAQLSGQQLGAISNQLQDLFIQIQGGQAPLTALLQQGSQLSAQFGGIGNAAKALGSLITPTTVALGALAVAVGGVALAYSQGASEQREFAKALIESGNAAGKTVNELTAMAQAIRASGAGSQGRASEILQQIAASGVAATSSLEEFTKAALRMEQVGGPSAEAAAKAFVDLGKAPLEASTKLNEAMNYLSAATVRQIAELQNVGRNTDAARVAQEAFATAIIERAPKMAAQIGLIGTAWIDVKKAASGAWEAIVDDFRPAALDAKIAEVRSSLSGLKQLLAVAGGNAPAQSLVGGGVGGSSLAAEAAARVEAAAQAKRAVAAKAEVEVQKILAQYTDDRVKGLQEEARVRQVMLAAGRSQVEIEKVIAQVREKFTDKKASQELEEQAKLIAELAGLSGDFFKEWERLTAMFKAGKLPLDQLVAAQGKLLEKQPAIAANAKAELDAAKQIAEARVAARRGEQQAIDAYEDQQRAQTESLLKGIRDRTAALDLENEAAVAARLGNLTLAEAINKVTIARLLDKASKLQPGSEEEQSIQRQITLYQELAKQTSLKELNNFLDPKRAETFGEALTGAFQQAGSALAKLTGALETYGKSQRDIAANVARLDNENDPTERARKALLLQQRAQHDSLSLYGSLAGAAKGFFKEGTDGYKALQLAETAFTAVQLASDLAKGTSAATVAVAKQGSGGDVYTAWARMAAMAVTMASLGYQVAGFLGGGGTQAGGDGAQQSTGTGTVLGDSAAKSESFSKSIDQLAGTAKLQLTTQSGMLSALRAIQNSIGGLTGLVLRGAAANGTAAEQFGISEGVKVGSLTRNTVALLDPVGFGIDKLLGGGKLLNAIFGSKTSITGNGLNLPQQSLGQAISNSQLEQYVDTYSSKKFFGIKYSSSTGSQYQAADAQLSQQFTQIFRDLYQGVITASTPLGVALDTVKGRLDNFVVSIGKIDLKDLTGTQIQEKLQAVLGAAADSIAQAAIPGLQDFQKVGEGYFETIVRVASGVETAQDALSRLGIAAVNFASLTQKQGDIAAEIVRQSITVYETVGGTLSSVGGLIANFDATAEDLASTYKALVDVRDVLKAVGLSGESLTAKLIQGAGSLDDLASSLQTYLGGAFFTDQERASAALQTLQAQFARIGINTVPQSYAAFRALVEGIDDSTAAGQFLKGQVIALAGAFETAQQAADKAGTSVAAAASRLPDILKSQAAERDGLLVDLLKAQGDTVAAAALKRNQDLAALTLGLTASEAAAATAGYDLIASLRSQIDATNAAATAAQQAAQAEAQRTAAVASQRDSIQAKIDDLLGDVTAQRARELRGLDDSNKALQQRYYDLQDEKAAQEAAQEAANKAAQIAADAAAEQMRAAEQLRDAWKSISDTLVEEAQRILGLNVTSPRDTLAQAQSRFASTTSQALSGDQDAAKLLPELARTVSDLIGNTATSRAEVERIRAQVAASLKGTAAILGARYGFSSQPAGTAPTVDVQALLAQVAATAPLTSAGATPQQSAAAAQDNLAVLVNEVKALSAKVDALQSAASRSASADERTRDLLIQVTDNGNAMQVEPA